MSKTDASRFLVIYRRLLSTTKDEEIREDNVELSEKRAEAFQAYEEKCEANLHLGQRVCPAINNCNTDFSSDPFSFTRESSTPKTLFYKPTN